VRVAVLRGLTLVTATAFAMTACSNPSPSVPPSLSAPGSSATADASGPARSLPARWWLWAASTPAQSNPVTDTTGKWCSSMQPDDLWFLAGTFGQGTVTRHCAIPAGRKVYLPVLNQVCQMSANEPSVSGAARCSVPVDEALATLDGKSLPTREATSGGVFSMTSVPGSPVFDGVDKPSVAWGIWIGPVTIPNGTHVLHVRGRSGSFTVDVTYDVTVS